MPRINEVKSRKIVPVLLIAVVAVGLCVNFLEKDHSELDADELTAEGREVLDNPNWGYPEFSYSYSAEDESLTLEAERPLVARTGGLRIGDGSEKFVLNSSGEEKRTDTWALTSLLEALKSKRIPLSMGLLSIGSDPLTDLPVGLGDELTIRKDFTDSDGDGVKGIENNETLELFKQSDRFEKSAYVSISNDTPRVYRLEPSSDRRWRPCSLEREKMCETVQAYDFR